MSVFIIAEIGINANGDIKLAKKLIDMAQECGCDAVKFQKRTVNLVYAKGFLDSYRQSPWGGTQRHQKEGLEFGLDDYEKIDSFCRLRGIPWFASAWDIESLNFLREFDLPYNKVASAMNVNVPFLNAVANQKKHTFISTGMASWENVDEMVRIFRAYKCCPFTLMHCVSVYAGQTIEEQQLTADDLDELCNLKMIPNLMERYGCPVGYSSHTTSYEDCSHAVQIGAVAVEKHITFDRSAYGSDHSSSLEAEGLRKLVRDCRKVEGYLGNGEKTISEEEAENAKKLRYWTNEEASGKAA